MIFSKTKVHNQMKYIIIIIIIIIIVRIILLLLLLLIIIIVIIIISFAKLFALSLGKPIDSH